MKVYIATYVKIANNEVLIQDVLCASKHIERVLRCMNDNINRFLDLGWRLMVKDPYWFSMIDQDGQIILEVQLVEYKL